jgi:UDP-2,4-diacetamido-2,4,6-trideoxy-beta-L-altropyranose hydrolase
MHVVIRADGGPRIGFGHLVRSSALADEFLSNGHRVTYATATPDAVDSICPASCTVLPLDGTDDPTQFVDWLESKMVDLVVTDSYDVDTAYQRAVKEIVPTLAVVLDDTRYMVCADVVINGNIYAPDLQYDWTGSAPRWCLGTRYALLRRAIVERATRSAPWRSPPARAIVTMGGSDVNDVTPVAMRAFEGTDVTVDVVVGPGFSTENEAVIREQAGAIDASFDVHVDPDDLPELLFQADLAVSALGSTAYELLALQTPFVGAPQVDNQHPIADALRERDAALVLEDPGIDASSFRTPLRRLLSDTTLRRSLRGRGRELVDGRGAERLYRELLGVANGTGSI